MHHCSPRCHVQPGTGTLRVERTWPCATPKRSAALRSQRGSQGTLGVRLISYYSRPTHKRAWCREPPNNGELCVVKIVIDSDVPVYPCALGQGVKSNE